MKAGFALLLVVAIGSTASAQRLYVEGDFSATVTGGYAYSGSFRGTIEHPGMIGTAKFHSDDFSSFDAELSPSQIGGTVFDASNLEVLLDIQNGQFEQLWFGGESYGPNGGGGPFDDFFVQWHYEIGGLPESGFFSVAESSWDVTFTGGNLDIRVVPEPSSWLLGFAGRNHTALRAGMQAAAQEPPCNSGQATLSQRVIRHTKPVAHLQPEMTVRRSGIGDMHERGRVELRSFVTIKSVRPHSCLPASHNPCAPGTSSSAAQRPAMRSSRSTFFPSKARLRSAA